MQLDAIPSYPLLHEAAYQSSFVAFHFHPKNYGC